MYVNGYKKFREKPTAAQSLSLTPFSANRKTALCRKLWFPTFQKDENWL